MVKALMVLFLASMIAGAIAGPLEGELFGHHIGDKYPVTANTKFEDSDLIFSKLIIADRQQKPDGFGDIKMMVTAQSSTIFYIYSDREFNNDNDAVYFATNYAGFLRERYNSKCIERKTDPAWGPLAMKCGEYELSIRYFVASETPKIGVRIELGAKGGKVAQKLDALMVKEAKHRNPG